jgi:hypothetical protein
MNTPELVKTVFAYEYTDLLAALVKQTSEVVRNIKYFIAEFICMWMASREIKQCWDAVPLLIFVCPA